MHRYIVGVITLVLMGALHTAVAQAQLSCDQGRYWIWLDDIDDVVRVYVNEQKLFEASWGKSGVQPGPIRGIGHRPGDSGGWQELTPSLTPGRNEVRIELSNAATCCSTALRIFLNRDTTLLFADALRKRDSSAGITYNKTVVIDRQKCATDTAPNS